MKSIVTLGWSIWTCNSKSLQVYAAQGSLLESQEEAADLASRLTAAEHREAVLKAALSDEQASHQSDARLAAARDAQAAADLQAAADKVRLPSTGQLLASTAQLLASTALDCPPLSSTAVHRPATCIHCPPLPSSHCSHWYDAFTRRLAPRHHHLCSNISEQHANSHSCMSCIVSPSV